MKTTQLCPLALATVLLFSQCSAVAQTSKQTGASTQPAIVSAKFSANVVEVLDGDTIRVANEEISVVTIRLEGIDAPESAQEYGQDAKKYLHDLLSKKQVTVQWKERDRYNQILGYVYLEKTLVNRVLVEEGLAWQFTKCNSSSALKKIEDQAKEAKKGLWTSAMPIAPWDWRNGVRPQAKPQQAAVAALNQPPANNLPAIKVEVNSPDARKSHGAETARPNSDKEDPTVHLTKTGKHYHRAACRHVSKSSIPIPLSRAASAYSPCQHCNPPR